MSTSPQIVIQDTCILLDLVELNLLDDFFQSGYLVYSTPQVTSEITHENQWAKVEVHIINGDLQIDDEGSIEAISLILEENQALSFTDASVYELGLRKDALILSSDRSLRKCCEKGGLQVHGMLWIIEKLHAIGKIDCDGACSCLEQYSSINPWAPKTEITKMISHLKSNR